MESNPYDDGSGNPSGTRQRIETTRSRIAQVRDDRQRLPRLFRPVQRILTGVPDRGAPFRKSSPIRELLRDTGWLVALTASASGAAVLIASSPNLLSGIAAGPVLIAGAVGRLRRLVVGDAHEATHGIVAQFYEARGMSAEIARRRAQTVMDVATAITFTTNGNQYRNDHDDHHDLGYLGTLRDPDGALLHEWGIWPDQTASVRRALWRVMLDPRWHLRFLITRARSNLLAGKPYRRLMGAVVPALSVAAIAFLPWPVALVLAAIWGPGYHIASVLQLITEHTYGHARDAESLTDYAERVHGRIPYRPMPPLGSGLGAWLGWGWANLGHAAARLAVLDSAMIGHGYHHTAWPIASRPFTDWWNTSARWVAAIDDPATPDAAIDRVLWGLGEALERQQAQFDRERSN
jgi:hypothetical protein